MRCLSRPRAARLPSGMCGASTWKASPPPTLRARGSAGGHRLPFFPAFVFLR